MQQAKPMVLVVEDDAATREGLLGLLAARFDVLSADNGEQALKLARAERPDVVLSDLSLPGMDGLTTLEALRKLPGLHSVPVVFLSGYGDEETVVRCLDRGATDFVVKPAGHGELLARLTRAVRQKRELDALEALAQTDALTGLANFRALATRLEDEFKRAHRYGAPLAVVMLDLDHLKRLNDQWGHEAGNRAILQLAEALSENLRETDFAARYGGDEFIVLLPHQSSQEAAVFAERLRTRLTNRPFEVGAASLRLSISVGVASRTREAPKASPEQLLQAADAALYEAKRQGRDRVVVFEQQEARLEPGLAERH